MFIRIYKKNKENRAGPFLYRVSFFYRKILIILVVLLCIPFGLKAEMRSEHYIIFENVHHTFDGPVISGVSSSGITDSSATIIWTTDSLADSFVVYSTDSSFSASKEQGHSAKNSTNHSVELTGLDSNTTYYYRVRSERIGGGQTTSNTYSFTTLSSATEETSTGGGGVIIIDKTDKEAPQISEITVVNIRAESVEIKWQTDEEATSFIEYGQDDNYGRTYGQWEMALDHSVILNNLNPETEYHFRVLSSDSWGNLAQSDDMVFKTLSYVQEEEETGEKIPEEKKKSPEEILAEASRKALEILKKLMPEVSLNYLEENLPEDLSSIDNLLNIVPPPILSGEPRLELGADNVVIYWQTDKEANSMVAIAPEKSFDLGKEEPYTQVVGDFDNYTREHRVEIFNLKPDTVYHYQLRSKLPLGPMAKSRDFTFRTRLENLEITSLMPQVADPQTAVFRWVTNKPADSSIKFTPYRGNVLAIDEAKVIKDNSFSVIHEIKVTEFEGGIVYEIEAKSQDQEGNAAIKILPRFSTSEDDFPPEISHIKADSTLFTDQGGKVQTIISWLTNEPSTSRVYYQEGVHGGKQDFANKTLLNTDYTKKHIMVITKFKPGTVYSFRVESVDSGGNISLSSVHTLMTPKQKESIFQMILRILEETFGWLRKLR